MRGHNIIRAVLFTIFFGIGVTTLSGSILFDVLLQYYHNKQLMRIQEKQKDQLKSLIADYTVLLSQVEKDPNFVHRIAPAMLGTEPNDANTIYPKARAEQLAAARKALAEEPNEYQAEMDTPKWLTRCSEPSRRIMLFFAGAGLILISFICFGPTKNKAQKLA